MKIACIRLPIATLWSGSLWTVGYIVTPTLFATLTDRVLAGTIAGSLFRVEAWLSVACAVVLLLLPAGEENDARARKVVWRLVLAMLVCTLVGYFGVQPFMAALREGAGPAGVMDADSRMRFGILHGIASAIYLVQSLLGLALLLKLR
jgi:hypothetical protein